MNLKKLYSYVFLFLISLLIFTGCGSSNGDDKNSSSLRATPSPQVTVVPSPTVQPSPSPKADERVPKTKGYFINSPIEGADYVCADGSNGLTDAKGMFECEKAPVTFKVGQLTFGTLKKFTADGKIYLQDLLSLKRGTYSNEKLKLLAQLIQSLDDDGLIEDKITITKEVRDALTKEQNFKDMTEYDVRALLRGLGKSLVEECGALSHLGDDVSCESDGSYYVASNLDERTATQKTTIKINIKDLDIKLDEYTIVTENQSVNLSSTNSLKIDVDKNALIPLIIANKNGRPILLGRKFKGDTQAEISLESTAEVFILRNSAFFGVKIKDDKELSKRIRYHKVFPKLVNQIKKAINEGSSCPTDPKCNPWALVLSSKITDTLDIKDLVGDK